MYVQIICTSVQTEPRQYFKSYVSLQAECSSWRPIISVQTPKANELAIAKLNSQCLNPLESTIWEHCKIFLSVRMFDTLNAPSQSSLNSAETDRPGQNWSNCWYNIALQTIVVDNCSKWWICRTLFWWLNSGWISKSLKSVSSLTGACMVLHRNTSPRC